MTEIPPSLPMKGPQPSDATGNFTDQAFSQLGDAAWQSVEEAQKNPNPVNIQAMMQCVNALNAYLAANTVPAGDPQAQTVSDIEAAFSGKSGIIGETFTQLCQMYGTPNCESAVEAIQGQIGLLQNVYNALDEVKTVGLVNQGDFQSDIQLLQSDIQAYNQYFMVLNPNPNTLPQLIYNIAADVKKVSGDLSGASDGYLTVLGTYLNTSIQPDGSETLLSLSNAVLSNTTNPPAGDNAYLDALSNALENVGEQNSSGGAFNSMVAKTLEEEY